MMQTEEYKMLKEARDGDPGSEERFLNRNMGLVRSIARRYYNRGADMEDIIQLGMMGLYKAVKKFDFSFNVKFSTYAVPMITGEIKRFLRDDGTLKVSRSAKELSIRIKQESEIFEAKTGRQPSLSEIAKILSVGVEDVVYALSATDYVMSLDDHSGDEDEKLTVMDKIVDTGVETEEEIIDKITIKEQLSVLKPRDRQIIIFRYFKGMTQQQVAQILKISQVQVSRIEKRVLSEMRERMMG